MLRGRIRVYIRLFVDAYLISLLLLLLLNRFLIGFRCGAVRLLGGIRAVVALLLLKGDRRLNFQFKKYAESVMRFGWV